MQSFLDAFQTVGEDARMGNRRVSVAGVIGCAFLLLAGCAVAPSFSEEEKIAMRDTTSEYQRAALEDLVVTETEYRDAVDALRDCIQDGGFGVEGITQDGDQLGFQSSYSGDNPPSDQIMKACDNEFITQIGPMWVSQRMPLTS